MSHYGASLIVGANREGLHLSVLLPFRIGHPPVFIPWPDISMREQKGRLFSARVELTFQKVPNLSMRIQPGLARKIQAARGQPFGA